MPGGKKTYLWGDGRRFNSYASYFRRTFGGRIQKVTIDAGFTCPNRDGTAGTGGCTFCNNEAFTPSYCRPDKPIEQQIAEGIEFHANRYRRAERYLAYFQSFSNTYKPIGELRRIYDRALETKGIAGIVVGTRPDCIDDRKLDYFAELSRDHYVILEYGVESTYDDTLQAVNRGHDFAAARRAIERTAERGINTGAHFILGFPGETRQMLLEQADVINTLPLTTVKFHQLQIFKGTAMAEDHAENPEKYRFFELGEYIDLFIDILQRLDPRTVIERFAGEAPPRYHAGHPWGLVRNQQMLQMLERRLEERDAWQGQLFAGNRSRQSAI